MASCVSNVSDFVNALKPIKLTDRYKGKVFNPLKVTDKILQHIVSNKVNELSK